MLQQNKTGGFTLIELLIVVAIIGILSSVIIASLNTARNKAKDAKMLSDKAQIIKALNMYYLDYGAWPSSGGWRCFGAPSTETCWYTTMSYTGNDAFNALMQPYMNVFPATSTDNNYNRYLYNNNTSYNGNTGAYLIWLQEKQILAADCPGGEIRHPDKYYYCFEFLGSI